MRDREAIISVVASKYEVLFGCLSEKGRRLWAAAEALSYGRGGISLVCQATGLARSTIHRGIEEIKAPSVHNKRVRKPGGGRKKSDECQKDLTKTLERLIEPSSKGDPESPLRWTSKSTRKLTKELSHRGYQVCHRTTATLLHKLGYSLQANKKTLEGSSHIDRDDQFHYINKRVKGFQDQGQPTISVDTKKKENLGPYKNGGRELCKKGRAIEVNSHDFPDKPVLSPAKQGGAEEVYPQKAYLVNGQPLNPPPCPPPFFEMFPSQKDLYKYFCNSSDTPSSGESE